MGARSPDRPKQGDKPRQGQKPVPNEASCEVQIGKGKSRETRRGKAVLGDDAVHFHTGKTGRAVTAVTPPTPTARALKTRRPLRAGRTGSAGRTRSARRASRAMKSGRAIKAGRARKAARALKTRSAGSASNTLRAGSAGSTRKTGKAGRTRRPFKALTRRTNGARFACCPWGPLRDRTQGASRHCENKEEQKQQYQTPNQDSKTVAIKETEPHSSHHPSPLAKSTTLSSLRSYKSRAARSLKRYNIKPYIT
jgi:hypothetical protein